MNKKIKELALQAEQLADDELAHLERVHNRLYSFTEGREIINQKFAELIVRECEKVISDGRYSDMACEGNSHRVSYNNGRYGASLDVKKHFGVEE